MVPDINPIDTQLGVITEILKIMNVSCNWDSPQYEGKTCKQSNVGVVQTFKSKLQNYRLFFCANKKDVW